MRGLTIIIFTLLVAVLADAQGRRRTLITDKFDKPLDTTKWTVEMAPAPQSAVYTDSGRLVLDTRAGVTVWLNYKLRPNFHASFHRKVLIEGKANDRLSDLNVFWMATDPHDARLFKRTGVFEEYDSLSLYYVGMGGNTNTTTRFRKYEGNGKKTLLQEYLDADHLLTANKDYCIDIWVQNGIVIFAVDGIEYFHYSDPVPLREGYFGFRSTWSRQEISQFQITSIQ